MDRQRAGTLWDHSRIPAALLHRRTTAAVIAPSEPEARGGNDVPAGVPLDLGALIVSRSGRCGGASGAPNISQPSCFKPFGCILECQEEAGTVKFCVLASGSSGNAALLATENTRILVDAGLSMRELRKRLASIGESLENIDAILITHEHSDHVAGLPVLARNKDVRAVIYMTLLAAPAIDWGETPPARLEAFQAGASFQIGDIEVRSFGIPHDAIDPVGYGFEAQGVRVGVATDLGYVPESIKFHLRRTDLLLLEANHDLDMLKVGPYH